jgi:hypothetical protein
MMVSAKRLSDHEAGDHKENVNAEMSARQPLASQVVDDYCADRESPQAVDFRAIAQTPRILG